MSEQRSENREITEIDFEINELLRELDEFSYLYDVFEEWWWAVENEARCGIDRVGAKGRLKELLEAIKLAAGKARGL